jgi:hypothetical protein
VGLRGVDEENLPALIRRGAWVQSLTASTAISAIEELTASLSAQLGDMGARAVRAVIERETAASAGLGGEVAGRCDREGRASRTSDVYGRYCTTLRAPRGWTGRFVGPWNRAR